MNTQKIKDLTADNLSLDALGLPKDETMLRFFPEARQAAITMMEQSGIFHSIPPEIQHLVIGFFIIGYVRKAAENWRPW